MNYNCILKMDEYLQDIEEDVIKIPKEYYNFLLKLVEKDTYYSEDLGEVELVTEDFKALLLRALRQF